MRCVLHKWFVIVIIVFHILFFLCRFIDNVKNIKMLTLHIDNTSKMAVYQHLFALTCCCNIGIIDPLTFADRFLTLAQFQLVWLLWLNLLYWCPFITLHGPVIRDAQRTHLCSTYIDMRYTIVSCNDCILTWCVLIIFVWYKDSIGLRYAETCYFVDINNN